MTARDAAPELGAHATPQNATFAGAHGLRLTYGAFDSNLVRNALPGFGQTTMPLGKQPGSGD